jgi:hypothetical protein
VRSKRAPLREPDGNSEVRRWLDRWRAAGPLLEAERWAAIAAMTPDERHRATARVLELWQPGWPTDDGEGLLLVQRVFARAR